MTSRHCQAVMLIGFGGPTGPEQVRPFLDRVLAGRPVPPARYEQVVRHYELLGGRSPYNELTVRQAAALEKRLHALGAARPVVVGFRNTPPFIEDGLRQLHRGGIRRALGLVLAPHRSESSWDRYVGDVCAARRRLGRDAPEIEYGPPWHDEALFIEAVAERAREALARLAVDQPERAELIFTAHSIPLAMDGRDVYVEQLRRSAQLVAAALHRPHWTLAFQSHSSPQGWLGPDIGTVLRGVRAACAVVIPLGFLCDHVEVLYDLDIEAAEIARQCGVRMARAATVGDHAKFIQMLAEIARHYFPTPADS